MAFSLNATAQTTTPPAQVEAQRMQSENYQGSMSDTPSSNYDKSQREQRAQQMRDKWANATPAQKEQMKDTMKENKEQRRQRQDARRKEMRDKWDHATPDQKEDWLNRNQGKANYEHPRSEWHANNMDQKPRSRDNMKE